MKMGKRSNDQGLCFSKQRTRTQEVIRALAGPPNFWDEATARHNVLAKYQA